MKVIITHDVDHIGFWEHKKDMMIPKFIVRNLIEFSLGYITRLELKNRFKALFTNKWQNTEEVMAFDRKKDIPATYFVAVNRGHKLTYSLEDAELWIRKIKREGFDVGVHGIAFDDYRKVKKEYEIFRNISQSHHFGIRTHYLKTSSKTLSLLDESGYLFDSSIYKLKNPYQVGKMWEFPLHLMDCHVMCKKRRWQDQSLSEVKERTYAEINRALDSGIKYFTICSHDIYFNDYYYTWKSWYIWLVEHLKSKGLEFVNYKQAIDEMSTSYVN